MSKLRFSKHYFFITTIIFLVELYIALYVRDRFIRPFVGDLLVVVLIYCFFQIFYKWKAFPLAMGVLAFAFSIEFGQYYKLVYRLGLGENKIAKVLIGTSYSSYDLLAYVSGIAIVLLVHHFSKEKSIPLSQ